jgi:hypothetical protein
LPCRIVAETEQFASSLVAIAIRYVGLTSQPEESLLFERIDGVLGTLNAGLERKPAMRGLSFFIGLR